jgi:hypothetical protein
VFLALTGTALATAYGCTLPLQGLSADGSGGAGGGAGGARTTATGETTTTASGVMTTTSGVASTTSTGSAECTSDAMCGTNGPCATYTCDMGSCKTTLTNQGMKVGADTAGDCKKTICMGETVMPVPDLVDFAEDGNPCTLDGCDATGPIAPNVPDGDDCGGGKFCRGGVCSECAFDQNCGADTNTCTTAVCNNGTCQQNDNNDTCDNNGPGVCALGKCCSATSFCLVSLTCCKANEDCKLFGCKAKGPP